MSGHEESEYGGYSGADLGPSIISVPFARSLYQYFYRTLDLGALEGKLGEMDVAPDLVPLIDAVHHVLAGGAVNVEIVRKGNPDIVKELAKMREEGVANSNIINKESGYYATPSI